MKKTALLLITSLTLGSCASKPVATRFDGQWEIEDQPFGPPRACLSEPDVMKLREILIRCEAKQ